MRSVLIAWELGAGLGHLMQLLPLAEGLVKAGLRVFVAFHDLSKAASIFGRAGVLFLQAPTKKSRKVFFQPDITFAHLLANNGFGDEGELFSLACAWRNLISAIHPDLIIFDHSPIALLGARGLPVRRALIGTGFFVPPDSSPLPVINKPAEPRTDPAQLLKEENRILDHINHVLACWKQPALARISQLYSEVDQNFLTTFAELDHYGKRENVRYWGALNASGGITPTWPSGNGQKIFAYLKPSQLLPDILDLLKESGHSTILFSHEINKQVLLKHKSPNILFEDRRLDATQLANESDFAILNANHGTVADFLLAGKPILQQPITLEQGMLAEATEKLGATRTLLRQGEFRKALMNKLQEFILEPSYRQHALEFASRYAQFNAIQQREELINLACQLAVRK